MAENNTPNTSAATPSAAGAKNKFVVPAVVCIVLLAILLAFFFGSVSLYRDAAKSGVPEAQFTYGMHYKYGLGVKRDVFEAWNWWRKAAPKVNPAQKKLVKSVGEVEKAAKADNADARVQLVWSACLANGWGVEKDLAEAWKWQEKAVESAEKQTPHNQYEVALTCSVIPSYFGEVEPEKAAQLADAAFSLFKKAANEDYADAQCELAKCYLEGKGVEKDMREAVKWYRKAAEQGYAEAQYQLGKIYLSGEDGVEKDEKAGKSWMKKAAKQGHKQAKRFLDN